jgi:hypothetical protein
MNVFSKRLLFCSLTIISTLIFISCSTENTLTNNLDENLVIQKTIQNDVNRYTTTFRDNFSDLSDKIGENYIQYKYSELSNKNKEIQGLTFPIIDKNEVIGRYVGLTDESNVIYIDFENYKESITIYDVNNPSKFITVNTVYDSKTDTYTISPNKSWCEASCTLGAIAIAASDGPAPFMDYLAVAYLISCMQDCHTQQQ